MLHKLRVICTAALLLPAACTADRSNEEADTAGTTAQAPLPAPTAADTPAAQPANPLQVEVDVSARKLRVLEQGRTAAEYDVAVGSEKWPTQPGSWTITQVVWNPEWIPPTDESWTEDKEPKQPGDPDNPLGRVQLVYDLPRTIHGTNQPSSVGKAVSHGSIRMTNQSAIELARRVMVAAGAAKDDAWYERVQSNRGEKVVVDLPSPVPIRVR